MLSPKVAFLHLARISATNYLAQQASPSGASADFRVASYSRFSASPAILLWPRKVTPEGCRRLSILDLYSSRHWRAERQPPFHGTLPSNKEDSSPTAQPDLYAKGRRANLVCKDTNGDCDDPSPAKNRIVRPNSDSIIPRQARHGIATSQSLAVLGLSDRPHTPLSHRHHVNDDRPFSHYCRNKPGRVVQPPEKCPPQQHPQQQRQSRRYYEPENLYRASDEPRPPQRAPAYIPRPPPRTSTPPSPAWRPLHPPCRASRPPSTSRARPRTRR
jgi:hypothetical protein